MIDNKTIIEAAKSVPCIEVLERAPNGSRRFAGPYYPDEAESLRRMLKGLRDRLRYFVAPNSEGLLTIYRRNKEGECA